MRSISPPPRRRTAATPGCASSPRSSRAACRRPTGGRSQAGFRSIRNLAQTSSPASSPCSATRSIRNRPRGSSARRPGRRWRSAWRRRSSATRRRRRWWCRSSIRPRRATGVCAGCRPRSRSGSTGPAGISASASPAERALAPARRTLFPRGTAPAELAASVAALEARLFGGASIAAVQRGVDLHRRLLLRTRDPSRAWIALCTIYLSGPRLWFGPYDGR